MRPKKVVLCVGADEVALSVLAYNLRTNNYRVVPASTAEEALKVVKVELVDLLLVTSTIPVDQGNQLIEKVRALDPRVRSLLLWKEGQTFICFADVFLVDTVSNLEMLERIALLCKRKRGPKKHAAVVEAAPELVECLA